ncbi:MAG: hypothetical protein NT121_00195 [Chloroflexi bacterium]|nr:hypothetical protein [Chloroflexota bacterium]
MNSITQRIVSYTALVNDLGIGMDTDESDALLALLERDHIQADWYILSEKEKELIQKVDDTLKQKSAILAYMLPHKSKSTLEAREAGRWWWFLNETQLA